MKKILFLSLLITVCACTLGSRAQAEMTIKQYLENALPPQEGRKIVLDKTSGLLTVTDTPSNHKLIRQLIKDFDKPPAQIMIEARFVEVSVTDLEELGTEFYWYRAGNLTDTDVFDNLSIGDSNRMTVLGNRDPESLLTSADGIQWGTIDDDGTYTHFPQEGHGGDFFIGRTTFGGSYLRAYIHALEEKGKANTLSVPKVTTLSGQLATMEVNRVFPYVSEVELENVGTAEFPTWVLKTTVEEKDIGISLEVTPHVAGGSDYITLDLHPEVAVLVNQQSIRPTREVPVDYLTLINTTTGEVTTQTLKVEIPGIPDAIGWPTVDIRSTQTSVITKSGRTIILGGMIREEETIERKKVPVLGDIPLLGNIFKYKHVDREKRNLLIFITATLITPEGQEMK